MQNPPPVQTAAKSSTGLDENIAALLSYLLGGIGGLVFFLIEKTSRLVRFHAMQSLILFVSWFVVVFALAILSLVIGLIFAQISGALASLISILTWLVIVLICMAFVVGTIICLVKAYQGQFFKLPVIGNFAEKFSQK